jgi:molybdenum cofactor guanylyltransferase
LELSDTHSSQKNNKAATMGRPGFAVAEGFVLAGGQSSRMGRDKALLRLADRPLVVWALDALRGARLSARIAGARVELSTFAPVIEDDAADLGPLAGICSALDAATAEWTVFVPVDLPFLPSSLIEFLVEHARVTGRAVTVASVNGFAQTFPAVVRTDAAAGLAGELTAGRSGCFAAFSKVGVSVVDTEMAAQAGRVRDERGWPTYRWFWNVNSPEELERARRVLA